MKTKHKIFGFTLIEMLVVIVILGILISLTTVTVNNAQERSRDIAAKTKIQEIATALNNYKADYGNYPLINGNYYGDTFELSGFLVNDYLKNISNLKRLEGTTGTAITSGTNTIFTAEKGFIYITDGIRNFAIVMQVEYENDGNFKTENIDRSNLTNSASNIQEALINTKGNLTSKGDLYVLLNLNIIE